MATTSQREATFQRGVTVLRTWAERARDMLNQATFEMATWSRFQQEADPSLVIEIITRMQQAERAHASILESISAKGSRERSAVAWFTETYISISSRTDENWQVANCTCGWETSGTESNVEDWVYEHARKHMTPDYPTDDLRDEYEFTLAAMRNGTQVIFQETSESLTEVEEKKDGYRNSLGFEPVILRRRKAGEWERIP